jgi:hypothetical protein
MNAESIRYTHPVANGVAQNRAMNGGIWRVLETAVSKYSIT